MHQWFIGRQVKFHIIGVAKEGNAKTGVNISLRMALQAHVPLVLQKVQQSTPHFIPPTAVAPRLQVVLFILLVHAYHTIGGAWTRRQ